MEIVSGLHNIRNEHHGCVVTMGNFDGVHRGHQMLIEDLRMQAEALQVPSTLITFEPQPREFFAGNEVPPRLTRLREKVLLLESAGLDRLVLLPFNETTARTPPRSITDDLFYDLLGARFVIIGDDFRFGYRREGNYELVQERGAILGYGCSQAPTLQHDGQRISSTWVRQALAEGDFATATALLGHEYFIMGRVVYGRQLGRQLGVPTANIRLQRYRAALEGVYCVTAVGPEATPLRGIANIGVRPTVDGKEPLLEVHLFDYNANLYGRLLTVTFKRKLRDEQAFESIDALRQQIERDLDAARDWFSQQ